MRKEVERSSRYLKPGGENWREPGRPTLLLEISRKKDGSRCMYCASGSPPVGD
jgi:hypothetical protein